MFNFLICFRCVVWLVGRCINIHISNLILMAKDSSPIWDTTCQGTLFLTRSWESGQALGSDQQTSSGPSSCPTRPTWSWPPWTVTCPWHVRSSTTTSWTMRMEFIFKLHCFTLLCQDKEGSVSVTCPWILVIIWVNYTGKWNMLEKIETRNASFTDKFINQ